MGVKEEGEGWGERKDGWVHWVKKEGE